VDAALIARDGAVSEVQHALRRLAGLLQATTL
jgi:hypothetical protein